jgi:hypothetical protein
MRLKKPMPLLPESSDSKEPTKLATTECKSGRSDPTDMKSTETQANSQLDEN